MRIIDPNTTTEEYEEGYLKRSQLRDILQFARISGLRRDGTGTRIDVPYMEVAITLDAKTTINHVEVLRSGMPEDLLAFLDKVRSLQFAHVRRVPRPWVVPPEPWYPENYGEP